MPSEPPRLNQPKVEHSNRAEQAAHRSMAGTLTCAGRRLRQPRDVIPRFLVRFEQRSHHRVGTPSVQSAQGSPVHSDETSSSNCSRHKSKSPKSDKKKRSTKNKDEPRNKQVKLFPRAKATEEHRSVDHIIFSLA
eukprot:3665166-Rhodomonas_salina.1